MRTLQVWLQRVSVGPDELYTRFKVDGRDVGAAYTLGAEQQKQGIPAHWNLYVAVENAHAVVSRGGARRRYLVAWKRRLQPCRRS